MTDLQTKKSAPLQAKSWVRPCAQVLIMDTDAAAEELAGRSMNRNCRQSIFLRRHEVLRTSNPYVQAFKMMDDVADKEAERAQAAGRVSRPVRMVFDENSTDDQRRYNATEIAVCYVGDESNIPGDHYLIVHEHGRLERMSHLDKRCDPLTYPLLFPTGQSGWHPGIERRNPTSNRRVRITQKEFYALLPFLRIGIFNALLYAGKLLQQFIVDCWLKIEMNRLNYI